MVNPCVTCGICFQILSHPVTCECAHSFCYDCVRGELTQNNDNGFQCPLCATPYTEITLNTLPNLIDHETEIFVDALKTGSSDSRQCQWCESAAASQQCAECMAIYCAECSVAVHKNAAKRNHAVGALNDASRNFYHVCDVRGHEAYRSEFFCLQCEQLCCAYCLQVGPHRDHRHSNVATAAAEARQQMYRDLQKLTESKSRLESQAAELNRVTTLYDSSYDAAENMITERFESFRQQLMQRELEARRTLSTLRSTGDASLTGSRKQFLEKLNGVNEWLLRYESTQKNGTDYELLESRSKLGSCMQLDLPSVTGSGFKLASVGDMALTPLDVRLDLQALDHMNASANRPHGGTKNGSRALVPLKSGFPPLRLTFPVDDDVEATVVSEGVQLRCVARGSGNTQIGVRSKEMFEALLRAHPEDNGIVSWQVRLDVCVDSFIGLVEKTSQPQQVPEGFYWKPAGPNVVDGQIGRYTSALRRLPICRNGDVVRFVYDVQQGTLRIIINGEDDRGVVISDLHPRVAACFIFYPGESITILF